VLGAGTHGSTYGGNPLGCAVALRILEVVRKEGLERNARETGGFLRKALEGLIGKYPGVFRQVRGLGFMLGIELAAGISKLPGEAGKAQSARFANLLHESGLLLIPAGTDVLRLLPPLTLRQSEAEEALAILENVAGRLV
jgi:acetylornithine/N-succinyldiaminopimelate aminotransferase